MSLAGMSLAGLSLAGLSLAGLSLAGRRRGKANFKQAVQCAWISVSSEKDLVSGKMILNDCELLMFYPHGSCCLAFCAPCDVGHRLGWSKGVHGARHFAH
jgi:hypothetical protein